MYIHMYIIPTHRVEDGVELCRVAGVRHELAHVADDQGTLALCKGPALLHAPHQNGEHEPQGGGVHHLFY